MVSNNYYLLLVNGVQMIMNFVAITVQNSKRFKASLRLSIWILSDTTVQTMTLCSITLPCFPTCQFPFPLFTC